MKARVANLGVNALCLAGACLMVACSDEDPKDATPGAGGTTGGSSTTGGESASGGAHASSGGTPASGGSPIDSGGGTGGTGGFSAGTGGSTGGTESGGSGGTSGSAQDATLIPDPSWTCGTPEGVPPPNQGTLVFTAMLQLGAVHEVGATQYGDRRLLDVTGGTFTGERIDGKILTGGLDFELMLSNGAMELEQIDILETTDGTPIYMRSCGFSPAGESVGRVIPDFEVDNSSPHSWLNDGKFAATRTVDTTSGVIELAVYDISGIVPGEPTIQLSDPSDAPNQPWDCSTQTGAKGDAVFTETVSLGQSISIGASKRGTRNIIPITGGTVTGRVTGTVLPGGADYQLIGTNTTLDARYSLSANDGEVILIRNCGPFGALVPLFETRADGPYAFLNANHFVSSDPGGAAGGVSITFYEVQ